jgi:hypothetical protein
MSADGESMPTAERLAADLVPYVPETGTLDAFWDKPQVDEALRLLEGAGFAPTEFLPDSGDLNFAAGDAAAKFYKAFARQVRTRLCSADGDVRKTIGDALNAGVGALLPAMAVVLAIPPAAVVILAPIAAILVAVGLNGFCQTSKR